MTLKEEVEDPQIIQRISAILIPREFTKLDEIINLVFTTAEDIREEKTIGKVNDDIDEIEQGTKSEPVSFYQACIERIEKQLIKSLMKRSRTTYSTADDSIRVSCVISKEYDKGGQIQYWFAFHPHQKEFLDQATRSYVSFGCGSENNLLMIPLEEFLSWLPGMHVTDDKKRFYWHVNIMRDNENFILYRKKGAERIQLNRYLIGRS